MKTQKINFDIDDAGYRLVQKIVDRFQKLTTKSNPRARLSKAKLELVLDIVACHMNGCELDLEKLLNFDDFNLVHDVAGIRNRIDRNTGQINGCFLPKCSKKEESK